MQFSPPERTSYDAHVLTTSYLYVGRVAPAGQFRTWLNDTEVRGLCILGPTCVALEVGRAVEAGLAQLYVAKSDIVAIDILSPAARQTEQLMQRRVPMTVTTELFAISGQCSLMAEQRPEHMLNLVRGSFLAVVQATIRPIVNMRPLPFTESAMLMLNTDHVKTFRAD